MMVKPTAPHPMVSISNQIGALPTGPVFLDEGSKNFFPLLMRCFPVFGHDDHDVSVLCVFCVCFVCVLCVFLVDMCVTEFNITIPHQLLPVISPIGCHSAE